VPSLVEAIVAMDTDAALAVVAADPATAADRDAAGVSVLLLARYRGMAAVVDAIVGAGAPLDVFDAAALDRVDVVAAILRDDPAAVEARAGDGFTALHLAAFFDGARAAALLVRAGADVDALAAGGSRLRPLHSAAASPRTSCTALLVAAGAELDARQRGGFAPLHEVALRGDADLAGLLLAAGADPAAVDDDGRTAADRAAERGHDDLARRLTEAAAAGTPPPS